MVLSLKPGQRLVSVESHVLYQHLRPDSAMGFWLTQLPRYLLSARSGRSVPRATKVLEKHEWGFMPKTSSYSTGILMLSQEANAVTHAHTVSQTTVRKPTTLPRYLHVQHRLQHCPRQSPHVSVLCRGWSMNSISVVLEVNDRRGCFSQNQESHYSLSP